MLTHDSKSSLKEGEIDVKDYLENKYIGKYRIVNFLGSGSSSKVVLAYNTLTEERVAIKIISRNHEISQYEIKDNRIFREIVLSCLLNHPNIVRLLEFFYSTDHFFLVFEYVKGMQLYDVLINQTQLNERDARKYFRQVISAIEYIHLNCIAHRDLKIENILIDNNDNVKILDFGLSNFYNNETLLKTFCGSLYFAAPELLDGRKYMGPEIDIWSLGVILYAMLCGKVPFDDENISNLQLKIKSGKFEFPANISETAKTLIKQMLQNTPEKRCDFQTIKDSEWINEEHSNKIQSYMMPRGSLDSLDSEFVLALSSALSFQFSNIEEELESFRKISKKNYTEIDNIYSVKRPLICMYYLLKESCNKKRGVFFKIKKKMDIFEIMHNFVNYTLNGENKDIYKRYFVKNVFNEDFSENKNDDIILWPRIRKSYLKGFFQGIKVKKIGNQNGFKKILLDIFKKHDIVYEVSEKNYYCSYFDCKEECYFKVSLYYNMIFGEYSIVLTCLNNKKNSFKTINSIIQRTFKSKNLLLSFTNPPVK